MKKARRAKSVGRGTSRVPEFKKTTLDNGVTIVAEQHSHVRSLSIGVWVKLGSIHEDPSINGISHFLEHIVFKGTQKRNAMQIVSELEAVGGELNAFTDREFTCFHATVLNEDLELAVDVLSDLVIGPTFPKSQVERERKVLLQELAMVEETPEEWIYDLFFETVWKGEPLGQPILGPKKNIKRITRGQLMRIFRQYYRPENVVVSVAGNFEFDRLVELCEKYLRFPQVQKAMPLEKPTSKYKGRSRVVVSNTEQTHLLVGFEGGGFRDPKRYENLVLSYYLGGGMSSRLFQEVREKAALAYSIDCDYSPYTDTGAFSIYVALSPRSLKPCLEILSKEMEHLKKKSISKEALELVKGQLRGSILMSADQMEVRQEAVGRNDIVYNRHIPVEEVIENIDRITADDIQEVCQNQFTSEKESVVVLCKSKPRQKKITLF